MFRLLLTSLVKPTTPNGPLWRSPQRTLFSELYLGLTAFKQSKNKLSRHSNIKENLVQRLNSYVSNDSNSVAINDREVGSFVTLLEKTPEDMNLLTKVLHRHREWQTNKNQKDQSFAIGPIIMRTLHHLKADAEAVALFNDKKINHLLYHNISLLLLLDLLYESADFDQVLKAFNQIRQTLNERGFIIKQDISTIGFAACYKLNTPESFAYSSVLHSEMNEKGLKISRKGRCFHAALALNHGQPDLALDAIESIENQNYVLVRNIKVLALARVSKHNDALEVLKLALEIDEHKASKVYFTSDVIQALETYYSNTEAKSEFKDVVNQLDARGQIDNSTTLDSTLCIPIVYVAKPDVVQKRNPFSRKEGFNDKQRRDFDFYA